MRVVIIGTGQFAANCLQVALDHAGVDVCLAVLDSADMQSRILKFACEKVGIPILSTTKLNDETTLEVISQSAPDYVISAHNMRIIGKKLLAVPNLGTVNFHNGPLPRYRGLNVYSWAIINGEREYGVTWHFVDEGIDTGDIIAQSDFPLESNETLLSLSKKGFAAGLSLFPGLIEAMLQDKVCRYKQDEEAATYYSRHDTPNGGAIDLCEPFCKIERLIRGLNFLPLENPFVYPYLVFCGRRFFPHKAEQIPGSPRFYGEILAIEREGIVVSARGSLVKFSCFLDRNHNAVHPHELAKDYGMMIGSRLDPVPLDQFGDDLTI